MTTPKTTSDRQILVLNKNLGGRQPGIFVGRPSPWGNPYHAEKCGRAIAIKLFRTYALKRLQREPTWLDPLRGADALVCYCAPLPCHAHVLIELINATRGA